MKGYFPPIRGSRAPLPTTASYPRRTHAKLDVFFTSRRDTNHTDVRERFHALDKPSHCTDAGRQNRREAAVVSVENRRGAVGGGQSAMHWKCQPSKPTRGHAEGDDRAGVGTAGTWKGWKEGCTRLWEEGGD